MFVFLGGNRNSMVVMSVELGMYVVYESANIMDYCICWDVGEQYFFVLRS